jgi:hypothetical protein
MPKGQVNKETQTNPSATPPPPANDHWNDTGMQRGDEDKGRRDQQSVLEQDKGKDSKEKDQVGPEEE